MFLEDLFVIRVLLSRKEGVIVKCPRAEYDHTKQAANSQPITVLLSTHCSDLHSSLGTGGWCVPEANTNNK